MGIEGISPEPLRSHLSRKSDLPDEEFDNDRDIIENELSNIRQRAQRNSIFFLDPISFFQGARIFDEFNDEIPGTSRIRLDWPLLELRYLINFEPIFSRRIRIRSQTFQRISSLDGFSNLEREQERTSASENHQSNLLVLDDFDPCISCIKIHFKLYPSFEHYHKPEKESFIDSPHFQGSKRSVVLLREWIGLLNGKSILEIKFRTEKRISCFLRQDNRYGDFITENKQRD